MSYEIIHSEPQYGICDNCRQHTCGILSDGTQQWVITTLEDKFGDRQTIGYNCIKLIASNMGISMEVVEKEVLVTPNDEQVLQAIKQSPRWGEFLWGDAESSKEEVIPDADANDSHPAADTPTSARDTADQSGRQTSQRTQTSKRR